LQDEERLSAFSYQYSESAFGFGMKKGIGKRSRGFSLLELMAVLVVLGFLAGLSAPAIGRYMDNLEFRKQVGEITAVLRYARLTAVAKGRKVELSLADEEGPALRLAGAVKELRLAGLDENSQLALEPAKIIFYPEGLATPGVLTFTRGKRRQTISVDPLTGLPILD
jgi:general secretion pathway protein H